MSWEGILIVFLAFCIGVLLGHERGIKVGRQRLAEELKRRSSGQRP